ncbi:MAG: hypothetical protein DLM52_04300 [Chthoniobacterales bacterium]|nr:MAG: hypothetical protein DLM52_04300 [Chthoniobacterales bacterium]
MRPDRIRISHATGVTSIDFEDLPEDIRQRYHYDPASAVEERRKTAVAARDALIAAATGTPAQAVATASATPLPSPSNAPAPGPPRIVLGSLWDTKVQGASETMRDLHRLFSPHAKASPDINAGAQLMMADGIPYLCPLRVAEERLHVAGRVSSRTLIFCPGFPKGSIYFHSYDGNFEDRYNRMYIVVDSAEQLLSVQLVDESPDAGAHMRWDKNWFCYNFVNYRVKTVPRLEIAHELKEVQRDLFRVDSGLHDPGFTKPRRAEPRTLEVSRWYVPRPFVQLILHCISKAM